MFAVDFSSSKNGKARRMPKYVPKVSLQLWSTEEHLNIRLFTRYWEAKSRVDPKHYPAQLPDGHWDEQYATWCETQAAQKAQAKKRPLEKSGLFSKAIAKEAAQELSQENPEPSEQEADPS